MRATSLSLRSFRSFGVLDELALGPITVLVGANNAGKSSLIKALSLVQYPYRAEDIRLGAARAEIDIKTSGGTARPWGLVDGQDANLAIRITASNFSLDVSVGSTSRGSGQLSPREPDNWIVPYLGRRRVSVFDEDIREGNAHLVHDDLRFLAAKLSRLSNTEFPRHQWYREACKSILGFVVTTVPSPNGQRPGVYINATERIPVEQMGDGVPQIAGFLAELALSEGKLFLVEEPENDLHPRALKALLRLMLDSAEKNQFVVSTHSNIVLRYLASQAGSKVYLVDCDQTQLPHTSTVELIDTPQKRLGVLDDLGYELNDLGLWEAWLILEESSAEKIVNRLLIPWFVPGLAGRLRTLAAGGTSKIEATFEDMNRLFLFAHLEPWYRRRAWVVVDGDKTGLDVVSRLHERFRDGWGSGHFRAFSQAAFERYYPLRFADEIEEVLQIEDKANRRQAKESLLHRVVAWCDENPSEAKVAFEASAKDVIEILGEIFVALGAPRTPNVLG
ncbi:MAG: AAA family ATPase [Thermoleophilia bacterium]